METFAQPRRMVGNRNFAAERERALKALARAEIDAPIRYIIEGLAGLSCCFTLQSCFGHFVHARAPAAGNLQPLPEEDVGEVTYRIAYLALCLQDSAPGKRLLAALADVPSMDPDYVQFGSPDWFWDRQVNTYALQVEPSRFQSRDQAVITHAEALRVQEVRDRFFSRLADLVRAMTRGSQ